MTVLEMRIERGKCAACGDDTSGHYSIHEFDDYSGREVAICDGCGSKRLPTTRQLWDLVDEARNTEWVT